MVARYTYDAWGKCEISVKSTNAAIAEINPYRYRGYYFDTETGFYYLQSRYYDPTTGRFINGDAVETVTTVGTVTIMNIFAYCGNDPSNDIDISGYVSLKSVLSDMIPKIVSAANKLGEYLLGAFGMSKKKYAHKLKYKNATKLMTFVNENKKKLKKATGAFGRVGNVLEVFCIVAECYTTIKNNISRSSFIQIAEMLFYAIKIILSKALSSVVSWIITKLAWMIWWARYLVEMALEYLFDTLLNSLIGLLNKFVNYLDRNRVNIGAAFTAIFKAIRACV